MMTLPEDSLTEPAANHPVAGATPSPQDEPHSSQDESNAAQDGTVRILVVDDDAQVRKVIVESLTRAGFEALEADSGIAMRRILKQDSVNLIILDMRMPEEDGLAVLRDLRRRSRLPVLFLSVTGETAATRTLGLEAGADDYLAKPFDPPELVARIRAILDRTERQGASLAHSTSASYQFLGYHFSDQGLKNAQGHSVELTNGEQELLRIFLEHPHETLTRDRLSRTVLQRRWSPQDRSLDVLVSRLRKKARLDAQLLSGVRGEGYRLNTDVERK